MLDAKDDQGRPLKARQGASQVGRGLNGTDMGGGVRQLSDGARPRAAA